MKNFFFWQNTNSIHQCAFLNSLAERPGISVTLIVTENILPERLQMGWHQPNLVGVRIIHIGNSRDDCRAILINAADKTNLHIFSGLGAFPKIHSAFLFALQTKCRIGIFTEPLNPRGFKGLLRMTRGYFHRLRFESRIDMILATGELAISQFRQWGYPDKKLFEWSYTATPPAERISRVATTEEASVFRIIFAGSLIKRKGYDILLEALKNLSHKQFIADFYCIGNKDRPMAAQLMAATRLNGKLRFLDFLPNHALRAQLPSYDLLVLPSRHDGWGAVITESLMDGTPVIVSSKCGSATQVVDQDRGDIVDQLTPSAFRDAIQRRMDLGRVSDAARKKNILWAEKTISGPAMTEYFLSIISHVEAQEYSHKPKSPWKVWSQAQMEAIRID